VLESVVVLEAAECNESDPGTQDASQWPLTLSDLPDV
jgi:hypothetical protein